MLSGEDCLRYSKFRRFSRDPYLGHFSTTFLVFGRVLMGRAVCDARIDPFPLLVSSSFLKFDEGRVIFVCLETDKYFIAQVICNKQVPHPYQRICTPICEGRLRCTHRTDAKTQTPALRVFSVWELHVICFLQGWYCMCHESAASTKQIA